MKNVLRLVMLFAVCLILISISIDNTQADDPTPVGAPMEGNDVLPSNVDTAPQGAPTEGNDALSNNVVAAPEGHASPELETPIQLSIGEPHGEPAVNP
jgi:hypothetical protein